MTQGGATVELRARPQMQAVGYSWLMAGIFRRRVDTRGAGACIQRKFY